jgi:hypothetical protein
MLVWRQPKPNQVNFSPWLEYYLVSRRHMRLLLYGSAMVIILLGLAAGGILFWNLFQMQSQVRRQVNLGAQELQLQQQRAWAESAPQRRMQLQRVMQGQQDFYAWWPAQHLSTLLAQLESSQRLKSWHWQMGSTHQSVVFTIVGEGHWQGGWQKILNLWPSLRLQELGPEDRGWRFEASYLIAPISSIPPKPLLDFIDVSGSSNHILQGLPIQSLDLQLTPPALDDTFSFSPSAKASSTKVKTQVALGAITELTHQAEKYGQGVEFVRDQGVQLKMRLNAQQWSSLAPLPSAVGWRLQAVTVQQTLLGQWLISIQWLPSIEAPSDFLRVAPSDEIQATIQSNMHYYAQTFQTQAVLSADLTPQTPLGSIEPAQPQSQPASELQFVGYSQHQGQVPVAWIKSLLTNQLSRAKAGHQIDGWHVFHINAQRVHLIRGPHDLTLKRYCLVGVCKHE